MQKAKVEYNELTRAKVSESRNIVISTCSKGGFTIAQQLQAIENDKTTTVFMKGAFHIDGIEGLQNLRDALNLAIKIFEEEDATKEQWDE